MAKGTSDAPKSVGNQKDRTSDSYMDVPGLARRKREESDSSSPKSK